MTALNSLHAELLAAIDGNAQSALTARWLLPVLLALRDAEARVSQLERVVMAHEARLNDWRHESQTADWHQKLVDDAVDWARKELGE